LRQEHYDNTPETPCQHFFLIFSQKFFIARNTLRRKDFAPFRPDEEFVPKVTGALTRVDG
jgi:hypothetical protein